MNDPCDLDATKNSRTRPTTSGVGLVGRRRRAGRWKYLGAVVAAFALLLSAAIPAAAAELMRVTFVRHAESVANASGLIDTSTPGPVLTPKGQQQAQAVVDRLGANNYDGIYASTMVRTQLTAAPLSQFLRLPTRVLPGLQEVEAGVFEGTPQSEAADGYAKFPLAWVFQGNLDLRIPGSIDGNEFDARVDGALKNIYDNGDRNAVVFSHGAAIMFWTMMNAKNLTLQQKIGLLTNFQLGNTDYVVIEGNPEDGWTLVDWNGQQFSAKPTLGAEVQLQVRTLVRQLAASFTRVVHAFATLNPATIVAAVTQGVADATFSIAKFTRAVSTKVVQELATPGPVDPATQSVQNVATLEAAAAPEDASTPAGEARNAFSGNTTPTVEPVTETVTETAAPAADPASVTTKPEAAEDAEDSAEPSVATKRATRVRDGNRSLPAKSSAERRGDTDKKAADTDSGDSTDAGGSAQQDAA